MYEGLKGNKKGPRSTASKIEEVMNYVDAKYVEDLDDEKFAEEVIEEALDRLDPHSRYLTAEELIVDNENLQGNFDGIGIEFNIIKDTIVVVSPISGGPSAQLGILSGDKIVKIEDEVVAGVGIETDEIIERLRGERGTEVQISIQRLGVTEWIDFNIKRDEIPIHSLDVSYMLDDEVGYIKLNRFSATTTKEFRAALRELNEQSMSKLILDLRQNPGGYLSAATEVSDEFIDKKRVLVYTEGDHQKRRQYTSKVPGLFEEGELVILIDEGSASASEIVAGAVQDWDRGKVVGRRSFGKGLVQEQFRLSDGSALRLTIARYHTPSGRCIQKPYDQGEDAYNNEVNNRLESGEMVSADSLVVADSLKFVTPGGNVVYGGGGIYPDVFVPLDTASISNDFFRLRTLIPNFSYTYFGENQQKLRDSYTTVKQFKDSSQLDQTLISSFRSYLSKEKLKYNKEVFAEKRGEIATYLKAYVARQLWQNDGYYQVVHENDETLQRAYEELKTPAG